MFDRIKKKAEQLVQSGQPLILNFKDNEEEEKEEDVEPNSMLSRFGTGVLSIRDRGHEALEQSITDIQSKVKEQLSKAREQLGPRARDIAENDDLIEKVFSRVYDMLFVTHPLIRMFVKRERFIKFCLKNRDRLIERYDSREQVGQITQQIEERKMLPEMDNSALADPPDIEDRAIKILNHLIRVGECVKEWKRVEENLYQLETGFSEHGHVTCVNFETPLSQEFIRVEITHLFGYFDSSTNTDPELPLRLLRMNDRSFLTSTAYLAVTQSTDGRSFASLQSSQHFLLAWHNEEIARILYLAVFDLLNCLTINLPEPIQIFARGELSRKGKHTTQVKMSLAAKHDSNGSTMEDRFINILNLLTHPLELYMGGTFGSPYVIEGFNKVAKNTIGFTFELKIGRSPLSYAPFPGSPFANLKACSDKMFLEFCPPASDMDIFTIRIFHVFGMLDTMGMDLDPVAKQFLAFLNKNIHSFAGTGAYIAIQRQGDAMLASLNCMLHFLAEWSDDQIHRILSFQLAQMFKGLDTLYKGLEQYKDISLTILRRLG